MRGDTHHERQHGRDHPGLRGRGQHERLGLEEEVEAGFAYDQEKQIFQVASLILVALEALEQKHEAETPHHHAAEDHEQRGIALKGQLQGHERTGP